MRKLRFWFIGLALAGIASGVAFPSFGQVAPKLNFSEAKGWKEPVLVHKDEAHRETSLALSPTDPTLQIICSPSGVPNTSNKQSYFHLSHDGGETWEHEKVEGDTTDTRNYTFEGGDCDVEFDQGGTMYSGDTWLGDLSIGHSQDGGESWSGTAISTTGLIVDRPWLVGGPEGTLHVTYQDLQCCMPSSIWYLRSTDYGNTFTPAVPVAQAGPGGAFTWQGNFAVSPDQKDLYLVYSRRQGAAVGSLDDQGPETLWVAASHDAGQTWTSHEVTSMPVPMSYLYPSIAMDRKGWLHVVFSSMREKDRPIWYALSKDNAETWTKPIPVTTGAAGYSPWIDTDSAGNAAIVWYGSPDPKALDTGKFPWYMYWARVMNPGSRSQKILSGTTTTKPMFVGRSDIPEFEMVKVDKAGRMHIGASVFMIKSPPGVKNPDTGWGIFYQTEK
ncbi:MAG: hypothetical protein QOG04_2356 [Actinomycetota bacterium]|nr:hypothetical protein [Actinomycetota bacterium]